MTFRHLARRLALLLVGLGWLALAHPQAQTSPVIRWTHSGSGVTSFEYLVDSGYPTTMGLPEPVSPNTYEYAFPAMAPGQHTVQVRACGSSGCGEWSSSIAVVKMAATNATTHTVKASGGDYATIQACADAAHPGDTCLVDAGTWDERVDVDTTGGTGEDARITFKANGTVTMRGFEVKQPYITIDGFTITGTVVPTEWSYVEVNGLGDYCHILNNTIEDGQADKNAIKLLGAPNDIGPSYVLARNNTIRRMSGSYVYASGDHFWFEGNVLSDPNQTDFVLLFGDYHTFRRNVFTGSGTMSGSAHMDVVQTYGTSGNDLDTAQYFLFEENWIQDLGSTQMSMLSAGDGSTNGVVWPNIRDWTYRRNVFINVQANLNVYLPYITLDHNTFYYGAFNLLGVRTVSSLTRGKTDHVTITNNAFVNCGNGGYAAGFYGLEGPVVNTEQIGLLVSLDGISGGATTTGIKASLVANAYINTSGDLQAAAFALTSIDDFVFDATYAAYKTTMYEVLTEAAALYTSYRATFDADYNYVSTDGFAAYSTAACGALGVEVTNAFCEAHGVNGGDPEVQGTLTSGALAIAKLTNASWTVSTKTLTKTGAFASYTPVAGDRLHLYSTTGTDYKSLYSVASKTNADTLVLDTVLSDSGVLEDRTDVSVTPWAPLAMALGADGLPWTADDGLKPSSTGVNKILCGAGSGGSDIGAYSCTAGEVFKGLPVAPSGIMVR